MAKYGPDAHPVDENDVAQPDKTSLVTAATRIRHDSCLRSIT
jgi:hypothetical protein